MPQSSPPVHRNSPRNPAVLRQGEIGAFDELPPGTGGEQRDKQFTLDTNRLIFARIDLRESITKTPSPIPWDTREGGIKPEVCGVGIRPETLNGEAIDCEAET
jgi:hypothetical protein